MSKTAFEIVSYSTCDSDDEIFRTPVHTGEKGEFEASLPVGSRDLRIAVPSELKPIRACIEISSREQIASCSTRLRMAPPFREQGLIVRTASVSSKYAADIKSEHPCAQGFTGVCGALSLANKILSKRLAWLDEEDRPIANVKLEFHSHSMGPGELFGSVVTDADGGADLDPIYKQQEARGYKVRFDDVILNDAVFPLDLSPAPDEPLQVVRLVKWRCRGQQQMQAVPQQPTPDTSH